MSVPESPDPNPQAPAGGELPADVDTEIVASQMDDDPAPAAPEPAVAPPAPAAPEPAVQAGAPQSQPSVPPQSTHTGPDPAPSGDGLNAVLQIPINVEIVLGSAQMTVSELAALAKGSKIPLDRKVGEPVDVVVNGRVIAHGSVIMLDDGTDRFGISLESLAGQDASGSKGAGRSA